jgi:hypothetical protein
MLLTELRDLYCENLSRIYESNFGEKQYFRLFLLLDAKCSDYRDVFFLEKRLPLARWDQQFDRLQLVAAQYED